jgi:hypothetical protein
MSTGGGGAGRMGGANGRVGGQLDGAARSRTALAATVKLLSVRAHGCNDDSRSSTAVGTVVKTTADVSAMEVQLARLTAENAKPQQPLKPSSPVSAPSGSRAPARACAPEEAPSEPAARAKSAPALARASSSDARAVLSSAPRGAVFEDVPKATCRQYDWNDVCRAGAAIKAGTVKLTQLTTDLAIRAE